MLTEKMTIEIMTEESQGFQAIVEVELDGDGSLDYDKVTVQAVKACEDKGLTLEVWDWLFE